MRVQISFIIVLLISASVSYAQDSLQAAKKIIVDNGNTHTEMVTTDWGGSHGIFFGSKINYTGSGNLWENGNAVYSNGAGPYSFGAFSFGLVGNGGTFGFYDGGLSTGANNAITWDPVLTFIRGGNVGVGTPAPQHKLDINGNMRAVGGVFSGNVSIATTASLPDYKLAVGGSGGALHGAVFYGRSQDGTTYIYTKNGWELPPMIMKLSDLENNPYYDYDSVRGMNGSSGYYNKN